MGVMVWAKEQARIETENYIKETQDQAASDSISRKLVVGLRQKVLFEGGQLFFASPFTTSLD